MEKTLIPIIIVSSFSLGYLVRSYLFIKEKINIEDVDLS